MSLVELIVVSALAAVVAGMVLVSGVSTAGMQASEAAGRLVDDLGYARRQAILLRKPLCFACDTTQGLYYISRSSSPTSPIIEPLTKKDYRVLFDKACGNAAMNGVQRIETYRNVSLVSASFDGTSSVTFGASGMPVTSSGASLVSGQIEIGAGGERVRVVIDAVTGIARVQNTGT